jgi:hypothetical protein
VDASEESFEREGRALAADSGADWVVANERATMGAPDAAVLVLPPSEPRRWLRGPKEEVAGKLLDDVGRSLGNLRPSRAAPRRRAKGTPARSGRARPRAR